MTYHFYNSKSSPILLISRQIFMKYNVPKNASSGIAYESTLLGSFLSLSCIPKSELGPYEFFNNPASQTKQEHDITESNLWIVSNLGLVFFSFHFAGFI